MGLVLSQPAWVLRTGRLSAAAAKVRNLAKLASDPNKFLLDDLPSVFAEGAVDGPGKSDAVVSALRSGLEDLIQAYPAMLRELEAVLLRELRIEGPLQSTDLRRRAEAVQGLTGNYRLDAFAARLASFTGKLDEIEGLASLAANKPPRDWIDRDVDHARVEISALAQEFVRAEAFGHVKGREDGRVKMAIFISDPTRPSPITPDFHVGLQQQGEAWRLADQLQRTLAEAGVSRDVALAALAELGARLSEPDPEPMLPLGVPASRETFAQRKGAT